jgi:hypothetical protein
MKATNSYMTQQVVPSVIEAAANGATTDRAVDDTKAESQKAKRREEKEDRSKEKRTKDGGGDDGDRGGDRGDSGGSAAGYDSAVGIHAKNAAADAVAVVSYANEVTVSADEGAASPTEGEEAMQLKGNGDGGGGCGGAVKVSANIATPLPETEVDDTTKVEEENKTAKVEEMKLQEATTIMRPREAAAQAEVEAAEELVRHHSKNNQGQRITSILSVLACVSMLRLVYLASRV